MKRRKGQGHATECHPKEDEGSDVKAIVFDLGAETPETLAAGVEIVRYLLEVIENKTNDNDKENKEGAA